MPDAGSFLALYRAQPASAPLRSSLKTGNRLLKTAVAPGPLPPAAAPHPPGLPSHFLPKRRPASRPSQNAPPGCHSTVYTIDMTHVCHLPENPCHLYTSFNTTIHTPPSRTLPPPNPPSTHQRSRPPRPKCCSSRIQKVFSPHSGQFTKNQNTDHQELPSPPLPCTPYRTRDTAPPICRIARNATVTQQAYHVNGQRVQCHRSYKSHIIPNPPPSPPWAPIAVEPLRRPKAALPLPASSPKTALPRPSPAVPHYPLSTIHYPLSTIH